MSAKQTVTPEKRGRTLLLEMFGMALLLGLALLIRLSYLTSVGHVDLTAFIIPWALQTNESGLFAAYAANPTLNYPPVFPTMMTGLVALWTNIGLPQDIQASGSPLVGLFKIIPIAADLGLIVVVYTEFRTRRWLRIILPLLLVFHPALTAVSAFWGQIEPIWTLGVVLAAFSFRRGRPLVGWAFMAGAVLTKIQPVVVIPIFVVLTYRRYGIRRLIYGLGIFAAMVGFVLTPFVLASGFGNTMRSYLNAIDMFPQTTLNAYNLWYLLNPAAWLSHYPLSVQGQSDAMAIVGPLTARNIGLVLLALWTLIVLVNVWRKYRAPNEYLWLTAMYFGFFILPTQIHERYLYPVIVTSVLAVAADARMWGIVLPLIWSYTYNIVAFTHAPFSFLGINYLFRMGDIGLQAALVQVLAFITVIVTMLSNPGGRRSRLVLIPLWTSMAVIIGFTTLDRLIPERFPDSAFPVDAVVDGTTRLAGYEVHPTDEGIEVVLFWRAEEHNNTDYSLFIHALQNGSRVAQYDGKPMEGEYPVWRWFADQIVVTRQLLRIDGEGVLPDMLEIGFYNPETMRRADVIEDGLYSAEQAIKIGLNES